MMQEKPGLAALLDAIVAELQLMRPSGPFPPEWVQHYDAWQSSAPLDFFAWLQYIYLPNRAYLRPSKSIVLQARAFAAEQIKEGKLLRLLIELEALI
ncbi:MAG: hypothetical protein EOO06_02060 [Chitinophagaceae bacterium]|nr:MAG: hypothetical protein EOO06_02060 [Chitinophagaceae bacterium]